MSGSFPERSANESLTEIQTSSYLISYTVQTLLPARTLLPDLHPNESLLPTKVKPASCPSSLMVKTFLAARMLLPDLQSRSPSISACCSSPALLVFVLLMSVTSRRWTPNPLPATSRTVISTPRFKAWPYRPALHSLHQSRLNRLISTPSLTA